MSLPYFYEPVINKPRHILSAESAKHCVQVLRMKENDTLHITNGKGNLFKAKIIHADKKNCEVEIINTENNPSSFQKISIGISLLKNASRLEWFLEKATEIGVHEIIPIICDHTEKQNFRFDRMNSILISAILQSRQTWLPQLHQPKKFNDLIAEDFNGLKLIAHCADDKKNPLKDAAEKNVNTLILIGPEGDFSLHEITSALNKNFKAVSLGNTRLRSETAGIVAATLLSIT